MGKVGRLEGKKGRPFCLEGRKWGPINSQKKGNGGEAKRGEKSLEKC